MIPDREIAQIQKDVEAIALSLPCIIQRKTRTSDAMGQSSEVWATVATCNAGMTQPGQAMLSNFDFLIGSLSTWLVRLPTSTDVRIQDHLIIENQTLVVQVILAPKSYKTLLTLLASEVRQQ